MRGQRANFSFTYIPDVGNATLDPYDMQQILLDLDFGLEASSLPLGRRVKSSANLMTAADVQTGEHLDLALHTSYI